MGFIRAAREETRGKEGVKQEGRIHITTSDFPPPRFWGKFAILQLRLRPPNTNHPPAHDDVAHPSMNRGSVYANERGDFDNATQLHDSDKEEPSEPG